MLIADDESKIRRGLLRLDWEGLGFSVVGEANTGLEALKLIREKLPDVVLTDIRMPGLDGLSLLEQIAKEFPRIKVIFITAYHLMDYALKAIKLGAAGFILKPTDPDEIMEACLKVKQMIEDEEHRLKEEEEIRNQLKEYQLTLKGRVLPSEESAPTRQLIQDVLDYMESHYMEELTIIRVSEYFHFNPDYLGRLFKKETDENYSTMLTRIRLQKAVELLADANLKVYEIANRVGIHDWRYFTQMFRKQYGMTPDKFRKSRRRLAN